MNVYGKILMMLWFVRSGNADDDANTFNAEIPDADRRKNWSRWEKAIERAKGWLDEDD